MSRAELKKLAKDIIKTNKLVVGIIAVISLLFTGINRDVDLLSITNLITVLCGSLISYLLINLTCRSDKNEEITFIKCFDNINFNFFIKVIISNIIVMIPSLLTGLIARALGITAIFSFIGYGVIPNSMVSIILLSILIFLVAIVVEFYITMILFMTPYVAYYKPELSIIETLKESYILTKGRKMEIFVLMLSFAPWYIIGFILMISLATIPFLGIIFALCGSVCFAVISVYTKITYQKYYESISGVINEEII